MPTVKRWDSYRPPVHDPLQAGDLLAVFVEPLLDPPAVVPGLREAGLHGPICLGEPVIDPGEASVDIGPDLGEAAVEFRAGLGEPVIDIGEAGLCRYRSIDLDEAAVDIRVLTSPKRRSSSAPASVNR